jgi:HEAT repeat protein
MRVPVCASTEGTEGIENMQGRFCSGRDRRGADAAAREGAGEVQLETPKFNQRRQRVKDQYNAAGDMHIYYSSSPSDPVDAEAMQEAQRAYLDYIVRRNEYMDPRGVMQTTRSAMLKLDEVYVSLKAERQAERAWTADRFGPEGRDFDTELRADWERREEERLRRMAAERRTESVELPQAVRTSPRMVVLGDPGAGKTTLMRFLALHFARAAQQGETTVRDGEGAEYGDTRLPIFVRIARYADAYAKDRNLSLRRFLPLAFDELTVDAGKLERLFYDALREQRALVLLDGLDEVIDPGDRAQIARQIDEFMAANPGNRFIVTSRIAGYRIAPLGGEFAEFTLQDMGPEQVSRFLTRWCAAYERFQTPDAKEADIQDRAKKEAHAIEEALKENRGVQRLATNPLLLTILCLIRRNVAHLPHRRVELYEIAAQTLLRDWQLHRGIPGVKCVEENEALRLLGPLAFWLHAEKPTGMASKQEVRQRLAELLAKERGKEADDIEVERAVEDFLMRVREHTGLFVERAPGHFGFMHLTFEEYFAGRELLRRYRTTAQEIYARRHLPRWEEPILLAIGYESKSRPEYAGDLIRTAVLAEGADAQDLEFKPGLYEDVLHRDLLFAAHCLGDCAGVGPGLAGDIAGHLVTLYFDTGGAGKYQPLRDLILARLRYLIDSESGKEAAGLLLTALGAEVTFVRGVAAEALGQLGQASPEVVSRLLATLEDEDAGTREYAAIALGQLGQASSEVVSRLLAALEDKHAFVRGSAAAALGRLGQASSEVVSRLLAALEDKHAFVRGAAAIALGRLGQASSEVVSRLLTALGDENAGMRDSAAAALGQLGQVSPEVVSGLLTFLADKYASVRGAAAQALGQAGQASSEVVSRLLAALEDRDAFVRGAAAEALGRLGQASSEVVSRLLAALGDENAGMRDSAAAALGRLGQVSPEVVSGLLATLKDRDAIVRAAAAEALGRLGQASSEVVSGLLTALGDRDAFVRQFAAAALGRLGQASSEVVSGLLATLKDRDAYVRAAAAEALGRLGQASSEVVSGLLTALGDKNAIVRLFAAVALGRLFAHRSGQPMPRSMEPVSDALNAALADPRNEEFTPAVGYSRVYNAVWDALWKVSAQGEEPHHPPNSPS